MTDENWDDIFNKIFGKFGLDINKINEEMLNSIANKETKPYVYGFVYKVGPDGKPEFKEFGNENFINKDTPELTENENGYREPLTDINEDNNNIYITYELPGIEEDKIKLTANKNIIELKVDTETRKYYKKIELNSDIDENNIISKFKNGIFDVTLKKLNNAKE